MQEFLEIAGRYTIANVVVGVTALLFLWKIYAAVKEKIIERHEREQALNENVHKALEQVSRYPEWREQSLQVQKELNAAIAELRNGLQKNAKKLDEIEAQNRERERNKLRDRLLSSYRYFTSADKNPLQAWSEMEAEAFWAMYGDYVSSGGNSHIKTVVKPAMRALQKIPMHEEEEIAELMHSRK